VIPDIILSLPQNSPFFGPDIATVVWTVKDYEDVWAVILRPPWLDPDLPKCRIGGEQPQIPGRYFVRTDQQFWK